MYAIKSPALIQPTFLGGLWLSLSESLAQNADPFICTICLQTHTHTHAHTPFAHQHFDGWCFDKPVSRSPSSWPLPDETEAFGLQNPMARPQNSVLWRIPWCHQRNSGKTEASRCFMLGILSDTDLTASGYPGFGKRTIRWELFQGDRPSPRLSDECVCFCASREVRPTLGIAKERA